MTTALSSLHKSRQIIDKALTFPMGKITARYIRDHEVPQGVASEHELELRRYLAVCAIYPEESFGMAGIVDELWHTFVIHTREYDRFCEVVLGISCTTYRRTR